MSTVKIFENQTTGKIKPMHAINNAPIMGANDMYFHYLSEAGIPLSRLHDTGGAYGNYRFVDIENIFRDFDADVNDPDSYDFAFTDWLLEALIKQGVKPFYRLGASIENQQHIKAYRIYPPKDHLKWAEICEHIIAHYNEGWANGYYMDIEYWEIWNEPDNYPDIEDNCMWKGSFEEYIDLYKITAVHLKKRFGNKIKIGGYASCGFYSILDDFNEQANSSPRTDYFVECFDKFMQEISKDNTPLDFFSWHSYSDVAANKIYTEYVREQLDKFGFADTENILNEWNPGIELRGTLKDSANVASNLLALQGEALDMLMYYDGQIHGLYQGLFNPITRTPFKTYYVFKAFNELYKLKNCVKIEISDENIFGVAAAENDGGKVSIMLTCLGNEETELHDVEIQLCDNQKERTAEIYMLDENYDLQLVKTEVVNGKINLKVSLFSTVLVNIK